MKSPSARLLFSAFLACQLHAQVEWQPQYTSPVPIRSDAAMCYDADAKRIVLFGGYSYDSRFLYNSDTWLLNGSSWSQVTTPTGPEARMGAAMVHDAARHQVVLFGGYYGWILNITYDDTWVWNGAAWTLLAPAVRPPKRYSHGMAYDEARQRIVVYGGMAWLANFYDDTWEWDGTTWTQVNSQHRPPAGAARAFAYDARRKVCVLVSGTDTWEWDGLDWNLRNPAHQPGNAGSATLLYDRARERLVLYTGLLSENWEYDGVDWQRRDSLGQPQPRSGQSVAYESERRWCVLFGGRNTGGPLNDWWIYKPVHPAYFWPWGTGCAGSVGMPLLEGFEGSLPWIGETFACTVGPVPLGHASLLHVGASSDHWDAIALPAELGMLGMPGCTWFVSGEVMIPLWSRTSWALALLPVPSDAALKGTSFFSQALVLDQAANPFGAVASRAAHGVFGSK